MPAIVGLTERDDVCADQRLLGEALGKLSNVTDGPGAAMRWERQAAGGIVRAREMLPLVTRL
jgi:hypothetical protein